MRDSSSLVSIARINYPLQLLERLALLLNFQCDGAPHLISTRNYTALICGVFDLKLDACTFKSANIPLDCCVKYLAAEKYWKRFLFSFFSRSQFVKRIFSARRTTRQCQESAVLIRATKHHSFTHSLASSNRSSALQMIVIREESA